MEKPIIILIIVGVVMLAGSHFASNVALDLSAGPNAEGQKQVFEAQAEGIQAQTQTDQAAADQQLQDETQTDDATRESRILRAKVLQWVLGIGGGFALLLVLIFAAVNIAAFLSITNFRFAVMPIGVRKGVQVGWTLPLVPNVLYLTHDDAPMTVAKLTVHEAPQIGEPTDIGLPWAHALAEKARNSGGEQPGFDFANAMETLQAMLNGRRQLTDHVDREE